MSATAHVAAKLIAKGFSAPLARSFEYRQVRAGTALRALRHIRVVPHQFQIGGLTPLDRRHLRPRSTLLGCGRIFHSGLANGANRSLCHTLPNQPFEHVAVSVIQHRLSLSLPPSSAGFKASQKGLQGRGIIIQADRTIVQGRRHD